MKDRESGKVISSINLMSNIKSAFNIKTETF